MTKHPTRRRPLLALLGLALPLAAAAAPPAAAQTASGQRPAAQGDGRALATATFAGGCFWCMEPPFDKLPGVVSTTSGYTGGAVERPSYEQVSAGGTGHIEAVQVRYDPSVVGYEKLLEVFWRNVDPHDPAGQFCDRGHQYTTAIFVGGERERRERERRLAEASKARLEERFGAPIATPVLDAGPFWPAEDYHQDYYKTNALKYRFYRWNCGRDARLKEVWGEEAGGGEPAG